MKNLIIIAAMFLLPLAVVGQSETTQIKKNTFTASVFLSGDPGLAIDYRRVLKGNHQLVLGIEEAGSGHSDFVFGYRKTFKPENRLSYGLGLDLLLRDRNVIGDGVVSRTIELIPEVDYRSIRAVGGLYYDINEKLEFMTELHLKSLLNIFSKRATSRLNFGLKLDF